MKHKGDEKKVKYDLAPEEGRKEAAKKITAADVMAGALVVGTLVDIVCDLQAQVD